MNDATEESNASTNSVEAGRAATTNRRATAIKVGLALLIVAGLITLSRFEGISEALNNAADWIKGLGIAGYVVFAALYIAACVFFLPGSVLSAGAGAAYGVVQGTILVSISSILGAVAAFLVGRYFARDWVAGKIAGSSSFKAIDDAVGKQGWKIVGLTRLSPAFPFNIQNYAYGLTQVSLWHYFIASWIGMIPGTVMFVYLGSAAGSVATAGAEEGGRSPAQWALIAVGLVATLAVTVIITRIAQKALKEQVSAD